MEDNRLELFRKNLRSLRGEESQQTFASRILCSQHMVSNYETGKTPISLETAIRISDALDIPIDRLLNVDYSDPEHPWTRLGVRMPEANDHTMALFESQTFFLYYKSAADRTQATILEGRVTFDARFDRTRRFLHGDARLREDSTMRYDCKLVIEGKESIYLYGIEMHEARRFAAVLPYPQDDVEYVGGCGVLVHRDDSGRLRGQRVVFSTVKLDAYARGTDYEYLLHSLSPSYSDLTDDASIRRWIRAKPLRHSKV